MSEYWNGMEEGGASMQLAKSSGWCGGGDGARVAKWMRGYESGQ